MASLTQVAPGGVERPDVALKEDLDAVVQTANNAKQQAQETADFLETRVPVGRTINSQPLDQDIVITADDLDTYDKTTIDAKLQGIVAGGYTPVKVNGHLLDKDVILSAGDVGAYSSSEVDGKVSHLVPDSRTVNGKPLNADVSLTAGDLNAYTKTEVDDKTSNLVTQDRKINGKNLSADITLTMADIGGGNNLVPRSFRINGKEMTGASVDLTAGDVGAASQTYVDDKVSGYISVTNRNGLGNEPFVVTDNSFATDVSGSGFYAYAAGTKLDDQGNTVPTSVSDRPTGSTSGRVIILTNKATYDQDGNVVTPASQDLLAFPNDLDGVWFKKSGSTVWQKVGAGAGDLPYPSVWAPLNDTVAITAGSAPFDTITIGSDTVELNSKSVTFARSTVATYIDNAGVLQTADVDEARFERHGALIEGPSINALFNSNDFTKWQKTTNMTFTAGSTQGPDAVAASAAKLSLSAASGEATAQGSVRADSFTANGNVAFSVFAKASERSVLQLSFATSVSTQYANFDLIKGLTGGNAAIKSIQWLGNGWYRCSVVVQAAAVPAAGSNFTVNLTMVNAMTDTRVAAATGVAGDGLYVFGAQVEALAFSTSYFPTGNTAPTTGRAADLMSMRGAQNWNAGPFTVFAEVRTLWDTVAPNEAPRVFDLGGGVSTGLDYVSLALGWNQSVKQATAVIGDGTKGATVYSAGQSYLGRSIFVAMRYDGVSLDVAANGILSAKTAVPYVINNSSTSLRIGGQAADGVRHLYGHLKNFRVWHRALKDSEIKGLQ